MAESARLFTFSATPAYKASLKRLAGALRAEGHAVTDDPLRLAEFAIAELAKRRNVEMPPRTPGIGGKRTGAGRKPKAAKAPKGDRK